MKIIQKFKGDFKMWWYIIFGILAILFLITLSCARAKNNQSDQ
jgi:hypothetical protein